MRWPCWPVYYHGGLGMSDSHDRHGYPLGGFFVAHKRFMGHPLPPQGEWGDILDGPVTDDEAVIEIIIEAWADSEFPPDRDDLRVWHIVPSKEAEDCTAWAVRTVMEALELKAEGF
jgi:hypothetical protein